MPINSYIVSATIPSFWGWTAYTPVIPKLYWDVYSQEERIKRLCMQYDKLCHYASMLAKAVNELSNSVEDTLEEFEKKITEQLSAQNQLITEQIAAQNAKVEAELQAMKIYIDQKFDEFAQGTQTYDVTTGTYRPSYQSMRRLYQALAYGFKGENALVSEVGNMTVSELSNKTIYNVAWGNLDTIIIDDQIKEGTDNGTNA